MGDWTNELDNASNSMDWDGEGSSKRGRKGVKPLSAGRVVCASVVGVVVSVLLFLFCTYAYTNRVCYPSERTLPSEETGIYCLNNWCSAISQLSSPFEDSYINLEIKYANGDDNKIAFYKKMLSTIKYMPRQVVAKNIYGNDLVSKEDDSKVIKESTIEADESVYFSYVDYLNIDFSQYMTKIGNLMSEAELSYGDVDYEHKLINVFVDFMNWLPVDELPIRTDERVPYMVKSLTGNGYEMTIDEDIYIDKLLFSSDEFYECLDNFSQIAGYVTNVIEVVDENDSENVYLVNAPLKRQLVYEGWLELPEEERKLLARPDRYYYKDCCAKLWCGSYYLLNEHTDFDINGIEYQSAIQYEVGDGSITNPAGFDTDVVTSMYISTYDELGNIIDFSEYPIRVTLKEYGVSQDAIDWFEAKDIKNRGIDIKSDVQYMYAVFEVTNLSDEPLVIKNNMSLCDRNGNIQARTGVIYGLTEELYLEPDQSGLLDTWQSSTELHQKYVVWGADFARRSDLVYFRLLAGDLENTDPFKGVTVNTSRTSEYGVENQK